MPPAIRQFAALFVLFVAALFVQAGHTRSLLRILQYGRSLPAEPFGLQPATRIISNGLFRGDQLLAIDGHPFSSGRQYREAVQSRHSGETLKATLSEPSGRAIERDLVIPSAAFSSLSQVALAVALNQVIPLVGLALGFGVVFIRPRDLKAWLVLFLMTGFSETVRTSAWEGPAPDLILFWTSFWRTMWPVSMMLFGIYFPSRSLRDRRRPWLKFAALAIFLAIDISYYGILAVWQHDVNAAHNLSAAFGTLSVLQTLVLLVANGGFFMNFRHKSVAETSPDGRRRLMILRAGSWLGLGPTVLLILHALVTRGVPFASLPWPFTVSALLLLTLFPLTLAYVIVVERAMNLGFVIRSGLKYAIARSGLWTARAALVSLALYIFWRVARRGELTSLEPLELVAVGIALLLLRKQLVDRLSLMLDRRFFREAYDSEKVLAGLASEVGRYLEIKPLFERVALRLGETLHVNEIVILLREGDTFRTQYSTRNGEPMDIVATSRIVAKLQKDGEPVQVYFDNPPDWIRSLNAEELQTLDYMRSQLLLPLLGRDQLAGIISLGPKLSEVPYTETDTRLLQAVAWQTGMALENSRLLASLAEEAAQRERLNLELEIAREVQERLFPQSYPEIRGVECAGYCRPARGVGGDYYDFLKLPEGKLGIAIGDVSGKGIAAALLMASLQASLRGQAISGQQNLAVLMRNLNLLVYEASTSNRYATFFYGEYDPATGQLVYVNAGHNPPFVLRADQVILLEIGGPVVGLLPGARYEQGKCQLQPSDVLFLYTDGISEAMTETDEEWSDERFIESAKANTALDPARMIQAIFAAADAFVGTAKQYDDMTLLVLKFKQ